MAHLRLFEVEEAAWEPALEPRGNGLETLSLPVSAPMPLLRRAETIGGGSAIGAGGGAGGAGIGVGSGLRYGATPFAVSGLRDRSSP
jgi:hypothetical protein